MNSDATLEIIHKHPGMTSCPREGTERILRGGSHEADARFLRPTARGHRPPDTRQEDIGIRIILVKKEIN